MDSFSSSPSAPETAPRSSAPKALWGVIGALAVAVAALGGTLLYQQGGRNAGAPPTAATQPLHAPDDGTPPPAPLAAVPPAAITAPAPVQAPAPAAQVAPPTAVAGNGAPAAARPAAPVCTVCGRVESVQVVKRAAPATGVGAVAGGVLGGVVGNQFGHGGGRTAATVIGAVGGGYAGNEIEKRTRTETFYQVRVRMDNGALRTVETRTAPPIGKPVTLKGQVLRPADGRMG
ncbi:MULTISPECIES: glycine zipper 2TM domain-containing protein [unclassified Variovorax]|uniref:glycine zipper 2TM domain-containing protein n=1 Tax=unclassified Variovorax TaxID=663243 RepID=UPI002578CEA3|nr:MULTISPECIES: glycine zipper 2TM domain-containing protein [unclassified Variovorax]MDM0090715.1 glycine zipper 2TM domain-containing protein [Variovorax sp. J22G40]MDM0149283.1 glycine zipper 2TM domain-containing protein [Variovorax sp. J2P1-31]